MSNVPNSLDDRMKEYEYVSRTYLTRRTPVIVRIDGKAFHTFTKGFEKPFDMVLMKSMWDTCESLCQNIQGCKLGYTQSDEISLLLTDYDTITTDAWFGDNVQKMASVSASMATLAFNNAFFKNVQEFIHGLDFETFYDKCLNIIRTYHNREFMALFDSRVFNIPKEEVCNYFIWRQQDASRNSVQMVGRANFSDKQMFHKNVNDVQEMLMAEKGINWNELPICQKRGVCLTKQPQLNSVRMKWTVDDDIPIFTKDRNYIEKYL